MRLAAYRLRRRIRETRVGLLEMCRSAAESLLYSIMERLVVVKLFACNPTRTIRTTLIAITYLYEYDPKHPLPFLYTYLCENLSS